MRGSTRSSKSSIVFAYSIVASTCCLYLLLSFGYLSTVQETTKRRVSDDKNVYKRMNDGLAEKMAHLDSGFSIDKAT